MERSLDPSRVFNTRDGHLFDFSDTHSPESDGVRFWLTLETREQRSRCAGQVTADPPARVRGRASASNRQGRGVIAGGRYPVGGGGTDLLMASSTPSKKSTTPVSMSYSAPTMASPRLR